MYMYLKFALLLQLLTFTNVKYVFGECPDPNVILPCTGCQYNYIECTGTNDIDLLSIFTKLNQTSKPEQKVYNRFYFNNSGTYKLGPDTFRDIKFYEIIIEKSELTEIDLDAFGANYNYTKKIVFKENRYLNSSTIFNIFNKFTNANEIIDTGNWDIPVISSHSFPSQLNKLMKLDLSNSNISKLESDAFKKLSFLETLDLHGNHLEHIPSNAFSSELGVVNNIQINLSSNRLTEESFAPDSLGLYHYFGILILSKQIDKQGNPIKFKYIPHDPFKNFIYSSGLRHLEMYDSIDLDCDDCRSAWLKTDELFKYIGGLELCSDGRKIDGRDSFSRCD